VMYVKPSRLMVPVQCLNAEMPFSQHLPDIELDMEIDNVYR
jgi:hypothetical protein